MIDYPDEAQYVIEVEVEAVNAGDIADHRAECEVHICRPGSKRRFMDRRRGP